jgi:hypothetical protein
MLAAALTLFICAATASAASRGKLHVAVKFEPILLEVNFNGLCFFEKHFVDEVLVTVHVKFLIGIGGLIQSHGQAGAASAAFV